VTTLKHPETGYPPDADRVPAPEDGMRAIHPGEIILEDFLKPWQMTPYRLAKGLRVPPTRVHEILKGRRGITAETALRLSCFLGCSPDFWLRLQASYDLKMAREKVAGELEQIQRYEHQGPLLLDGEWVEQESQTDER
jgi:antitoxin HigA-1